MAVVRWEPARELHSLQREVNRLFGTVFEGGAGDVAGSRQWVPAMDLVETKDEYVLRADLPGLGQDEVVVELEDNVLTVSGERHAEHEEQPEGYYRIERASGSFSRALTLPDGVDGSGIRATFDRGVLEVRVPKPEQPKPHRVAIAVGEQPATIDGDEAAETGA